MQTLKIVIKGDTFESVGVPFADVAPLLDKWLGVIGGDDATSQAKVDALTDRVAATNTELESSVKDYTPPA